MSRTKPTYSGAWWKVFLSRQPDLEVVAQAGSLTEARKLAHTASFDEALNAGHDDKDMAALYHAAKPEGG